MLGAEGEVCTPRPRGWLRTSLQRSAHGERVAGPQRRGGHGTRRRRTGSARAASEGVPAVPGHSGSPRRGLARLPLLPGQPPPRGRSGGRRASYDSLKLSRSPLRPPPGPCLWSPCIACAPRSLARAPRRHGRTHPLESCAPRRPAAVPAAAPTPAAAVGAASEPRSSANRPSGDARLLQFALGGNKNHRFLYHSTVFQRAGCCLPSL